MVVLDKEAVKDKVEFINKYINAPNAASGSAVDANSNVTHKTIAALDSELYKDYTIQLNREIVYNKIESLYSKDLADEFLDDLKSHLIYVNDETSLKPYCTSVSLYPFILEGTKSMGGVSGPPKNLQSFNGSFVNCVYQIASNFAGAVATVEYLHMFDWFARKQYGDNYLETNAKEIKQELQGTVYALNQPASARGELSPLSI